VENENLQKKAKEYAARISAANTLNNTSQANGGRLAKVISADVIPLLMQLGDSEEQVLEVLTAADKGGVENIVNNLVREFVVGSTRESRLENFLGQGCGHIFQLAIDNGYISAENVKHSSREAIDKLATNE